MLMLSFNHVLTLSLSWHTRCKTGELLRILDRGSAINRIGEPIGFTVIPGFVDVYVALAVFVVRFKLALRVMRRMNELDVVTCGIHTNCLLNCETVKCFKRSRMRRRGIWRLLWSTRV
ncbi:uncharacterized protein BJ212DRAFT_452982 [Suillus subaureus]|uniref:Uncharacterized protein n=1 Tax=Suillus subaureus TaxID=48587 RepID=A0A9P7E675_9AGAM|nr:uncharacterized protein BJ212DRAFT_452982 [Suillus subaureus]KAG1812494.1 hypothetical protein BJ212DRAFT_452982 [Suillus subaureus]